MHGAAIFRIADHRDMRVIERPAFLWMVNQDQQGLRRMHGSNRRPH